jgi:hypothetical protein
MPAPFVMSNDSVYQQANALFVELNNCAVFSDERHPPAFNIPKDSFIELKDGHPQCIRLFQCKSFQDSPHSLFSYCRVTVLFCFTVQRLSRFISHHCSITPKSFCHSGTR